MMMIDLLFRWDDDYITVVVLKMKIKWDCCRFSKNIIIFYEYFFLILRDKRSREELEWCAEAAACWLVLIGSAIVNFWNQIHNKSSNF
jgi:hypothetical protein